MDWSKPFLHLGGVPSSPFGNPPLAIRQAIPLVPFSLETEPSGTRLGEAWEEGAETPAVFRFSFGASTATHRVRDSWTACCEVYLQAQLIRQAGLKTFAVAGDELFNVSYVDDALVCSWSQEHLFAVKRQEVVASAELLIEQALARVSSSARDRFVALGASLITNDCRFQSLEQEA